MNSPYRAHPALLSATPATGNTIPFPAGGASLTHGKPPSPRPPAPPAKSDGASKLVALVKLEGDIRQQKSQRHRKAASRPIIGCARRSCSEGLATPP